MSNQGNKPRRDTCANCRYFARTEGLDSGRCHRNAPRPVYPNPVTDDDTRWPDVWIDDWCGEWAPHYVSQAAPTPPSTTGDPS